MDEPSGTQFHAGDPPTILVVEDDYEIADLLETLFECEGYRVFVARRATDALQILREHWPDLITLDLHLPGPNGQDVLAGLDADPRLKCIPVVVLSAYTARLRPTAQVIRVLDKPFDLDSLLGTIESTLLQQAA